MKRVLLLCAVACAMSWMAACGSSTKFPPDNEAKADYLENKKEKYKDPTKPKDKYEKDSGKGGGVEPKTDR